MDTEWLNLDEARRALREHFNNDSLAHELLQEALADGKIQAVAGQYAFQVGRARPTRAIDKHLDIGFWREATFGLDENSAYYYEKEDECKPNSSCLSSDKDDDENADIDLSRESDARRHDAYNVRISVADLRKMWPNINLSTRAGEISLEATHTKAEHSQKKSGTAAGGVTATYAWRHAAAFVAAYVHVEGAPTEYGPLMKPLKDFFRTNYQKVPDNRTIRGFVQEFLKEYDKLIGN